MEAPEAGSYQSPIIAPIHVNRLRVIARALPLPPQSRHLVDPEGSPFQHHSVQHYRAQSPGQLLSIVCDEEPAQFPHEVRPGRSQPRLLSGGQGSANSPKARAGPLIFHEFGEDAKHGAWMDESDGAGQSFPGFLIDKLDFLEFQGPELSRHV